MLLPIAPELRQILAVPEDVEKSLEFPREGNWPEWTARTAHGLCDFILEVIGRTPFTVTFSNWAAADELDREFVATLARRAPRIVLSFKADGIVHAEPALDGPALADVARTHLSNAYYAAAIETGNRAIATLDGDAPAPHVCDAVRAILFGQMMLGRLDQVDALAEAWLSRSGDPALLAHICYAKALMDVRLRAPGDRDLVAARRWVERAEHHTAAMPIGRGRAVNLSFMKNTLALIEMREGNLGTARRLLDKSIRMLARGAPEAFAVEVIILLRNSARLHLKQGNDVKALTDLNRLLAIEPGNGAARAERARMKAKTGDSGAALADLDAAIAWEPPFADYHMQRGLLRLETGDTAGGAEDARRLLQLVPGDARALCLLGLCQLRDGKSSSAEQSFSRAIRLDPLLADGWANRASARMRLGRLPAARADLERAMTLRCDPVIARNRAKVAAMLEGVNRV